MSDIGFDIFNDICFNLQRASRNITRYYDRKLRKKLIRCNQLFLLVIFSDKELSKKNLCELAEYLSMDRATLSVNIGELRKKGFVEEIPVNDKRVRLHSITKSGEDMLKDSIKIILDLKEEIESGIDVFDNKNYKGFIETLSSVIKNVKDGSGRV